MDCQRGRLLPLRVGHEHREPPDYLPGRRSGEASSPFLGPLRGNRRARYDVPFGRQAWKVRQIDFFPNGGASHRPSAAGLPSVSDICNDEASRLGEEVRIAVGQAGRIGIGGARLPSVRTTRTLRGPREQLLPSMQVRMERHIHRANRRVARVAGHARLLRPGFEVFPRNYDDEQSKDRTSPLRARRRLAANRCPNQSASRTLSILVHLGLIGPTRL